MKQENNFDLLRLLAATAVFAIHVYALSRQAQWSFLQFLSPALAIDVFFVISGFLIFRSFDRSSSIYSYFDKRIRRLFPAYVVIIFCMIALGMVLTDLSFSEYFGKELGVYFLSNILYLNFLKPNLPGVFTENIYTAVNGTLWTLKIEIMFYLSVPIFSFLMKRLGINLVLVSGYLLSFVYWWVLNEMHANTGHEFYSELGKQLPGQLGYFFSGAFFYYNPLSLEKYKKIFGPVAILAAIGFSLAGWNIVYPFALAASVIYFAMYFPYLGNFTKYGDLSYGIYLIHFPVLQALIHFHVFERWPIFAPFLAILIVVFGALVLWNFVEKKFLSEQSHYVKSA